MKDFVKLLISASEKAANIARIIRSDPELLKLLIEEKTDEDKNKRFIQDFKTLADVLIQESLKHDISTKYPEMTDNIYGEETNTFSNASGETITVKIQDTPEKTAELLSRVIAQDGSGNSQAAKLLAEEIHKKMHVDDEASEVPMDNLIDSYADVGIWIDPIDGTNEYIKGSEEFDVEFKSESDRIWPAGLHCVTVLIGAFHLHSGQPLVGVVNQPFWQFDPSTKSWQGRNFWGVCAKEQLFHSPISMPFSSDLEVAESLEEEKKTVILSRSEDEDVIKKLGEKFDLKFSAGAGYKVLCVIIGIADLYVLSKDSTHFWDTCGPHAILESLGGGIMNFKDLVESSNSGNEIDFLAPDASMELSYGVDEQKLKDHFKNSGGVLAYRDVELVGIALDCFKNENVACDD